MLQFDSFEWLVVICGAVVMGFSKTGIVATGILFVPLFASVMPARESTGFALPMLCLADVVAIIYWRKHVNFRQLFRLLPWTVGGVVIGYVLLGRLDNQIMMPVIGSIVLLLVVLTIWQNYRSDKSAHIPTYWWFAASIGILLGMTSMLANAAGVVLTIYLLAMRLEKRQFIGTGAWFFWIVNMLKMPFSLSLNLITVSSLLTNATLIPAVLLGTWLGVKLVHRIPQHVFNLAVGLISAGGGIYLCIKPLLN